MRRVLKYRPGRYYFLLVVVYYYILIYLYSDLLIFYQYITEFWCKKFLSECVLHILYDYAVNFKFFAFSLPQFGIINNLTWLHAHAAKKHHVSCMHASGRLQHRQQLLAVCLPIYIFFVSAAKALYFTLLFALNIQFCILQQMRVLPYLVAAANAASAVYAWRWQQGKSCNSCSNLKSSWASRLALIMGPWC